MNIDIGAVIPARLGSGRVKQKVFVSIDGNETLLERKIKQLRKILPVERVIVNTESEKIADLAVTCGASVVFRDIAFSIGHEKTFSELIEHVVNKLDFKHVAWTPFVVPFLNTNEFSAAFKTYELEVVKRKKFDSLVSVVPLKEYVWFENKPLNYHADCNHTISQDLPDWVRVTNGLYMAPKIVMLRERYVLGKKVCLFKSESKCGIDIDTLFDVEIAKAYARVLSES